jgi:hypothetical protein
MSKVQSNNNACTDHPGRSGFDIRTFECRACDHIYQRVVALVDPMKSKETTGWFRGELRAPT